MHTDVRERPAHRGGRVVGVDSPGTPWHDAFAMLEVWGEYPVEAGEIQTRPGDQGGQPGDGRSCASLRPRHTVHPVHKVERFQHHVGRTITEGLLVTVHDPALAIDGEALGGNGHVTPDIHVRGAPAAHVVSLRMRKPRPSAATGSGASPPTAISAAPAKRAAGWIIRIRTIANMLRQAARTYRMRVARPVHPGRYNSCAMNSFVPAVARIR